MINTEIITNILQQPILRHVLTGVTGIGLATTIIRAIPPYRIVNATKTSADLSRDLIVDNDGVTIPTGAQAVLEIKAEDGPARYLYVDDFREGSDGFPSSVLRWGYRVGENVQPKKTPFAILLNQFHPDGRHKIFKLFDTAIKRPMANIIRH